MYGLTPTESSIFVQARRTAGDDHPVEIVVEDVLLDLLLPRLGTGVDDVLGHDHALGPGHVVGDLPAIHGLGDVQPAVTDVDADAGFLFNGFGWFGHCGFSEEVV
jgi:hypothetical protein